MSEPSSAAANRLFLAEPQTNTRLVSQVSKDGTKPRNQTEKSTQHSRFYFKSSLKLQKRGLFNFICAGNKKVTITRHFFLIYFESNNKLNSIFTSQPCFTYFYYFFPHEAHFLFGNPLTEPIICYKNHSERNRFGFLPF